MRNDKITDAVLHNGLEMCGTRLGESGHAVFGPYVGMTSGVYEVEFTVALSPGQALADDICAILDVAIHDGERTLAQVELRPSDLSDDVRVFKLLFVLREMGRLEFRVATNGSAKMLVGPDPSCVRVSGVLDEAPDEELSKHTPDKEVLALETRRILAKLRPYALTEHKKVRLGNQTDGGYVCVDDFENIDTAFSFGINDDISWDRDAADRGLTIYQFDHTVSDPAPHDQRMIFEPKRIDEHSDDHNQALGDLIRRHDKGRERPNIILKMDIEGSEWSVLGATSSQELSRLAWIVCELHYFQGLAQLSYRERIDRALGKLHEHFAVVHVHANVWGGISNIANLVIPNVIEVLLVNRSHYHVKETDELFPTPLDKSCDLTQPDFYLGGFRF
jgi:hypothetical protein